MLYTIWFEVASLFFITLLWIFYTVQYKNKTALNIAYRNLTVWVFLMTLTDVISAITISYYWIVPPWINYITNGSSYIAVGISGYCFVEYVNMLVNGENARSLWINNVIIWLFVVAECVNPFIGFFYSFDDTGYVHGPLYLLQMVVLYFFVLRSAAILAKNFKKLENRKIVATGSYVALMLIIGMVQVFIVPSFLMTGFASTLTLLIIYLTMETPDYYKLLQTMEELEESRAEANIANETKSRFLANMSHEIRTPLNSVLGMDEMILRETKDPEILDYARSIKTSGNTLLGIINDILDFSKIESGMMTITEGDFDFSSTISNIYTMMNQKAEEKKLEFNIWVNDKLPKTVNGDEMRISQIIINLINNAIKYTETGSVSVRFDYEMLGSEQILFLVSVKDTGIGIKPEDKAKLFEEFERLDLKRNRTVEGTGLGLAIANRLSQQMGGRIKVESVYEVGSIFSLELPLAIVDRQPMGEFKVVTVASEDENYKESFVAPNAKILAVDDNQVNLEVLKKLLKKTEVQITDVTSGKKALKLLASEEFHIVLLDHMMPEMDGIETLHRAKEIEAITGRKLIYIALTANAIQGAAEMYKAEGFDDYITKPVSGKVLERKLKEYIVNETLVK